MPDFALETALHRQGYRAIAGVDEVGRGPWAGPVTACAVILNPTALPEAVNDSKQLSAAKREALFDHLCATCHWAIGEASVAEIDTYNIRNATFLAMQRALATLPVPADYALIDGNALPKELPCPAQAVVKGDATSLSIATASVIAKVTRDRLMTRLHTEFPHFGWDTNAGYGTKTHQQGLATHGLTPHHRRSFKPIQLIVERM